MNFKKTTFFPVFIISIMAVIFIAYAEEPVVVTEDSAALSSGQEAASKNGNDTQWAWGEVTNLDLQAKTLTLKYLDYETDQEKELVLTVDEKTNFENINNFDGIKIKDTLSIDYRIDFDGKSIAKNINFEKSDSAPAAAPVEENALPAEIAVEPVVDISMQAASPAPSEDVTAPVEAAVPPPVEISIPLDAPSTAQLETVTAPAVQEDKTQQ